jgi:hypothetical protein
MPKARIENLMTELHDRFGELEPSPQQEQLLAELQKHLHAVTESDKPDLTPVETIELLLDNLGEDHPRVATVLRELMDTLKNIGV